MAEREFIKMHGLGNDFVIVDAQARPISIGEVAARQLSDRHTGIGFDQLITIEAAPDEESDVRVRIYNADGSEVGACGNAMRCVARLMLQDNTSKLRIRSDAGLLEAWRHSSNENQFSVDMGPARDHWQDIPLARECDTNHVPLARGAVSDPVAVNMGNPHAVFFVEDVNAIPIETLGPELEHDPLFPERANIGFAQITGSDSMRLRVWERGAGLTLACGSGACAAAVAAHRRGLTGRKVQVTVDGGELNIELREDDHVVMSGPAEESFRGTIAEDAFAASAGA
ncbi:MAG: diaminopimelate epimerase [Alphaproteobacteria bacterium]|jgi:diaminopimelate epimerase|nr:diaminopimelate epimerase [Alphaproteobacteria bacterium]